MGKAWKGELVSGYSYKKKKIRSRLIKKFGSKCFYCGIELPSEYLDIDHIKSKARGGKLEEKNSVLSCKRCNSSKHDKDLNDWLKHNIRIRDKAYSEYLYRNEIVKRLSALLEIL